MASVEKAELEIVNNKVHYTIYFTRLFLTLVFAWISFSLFEFLHELEFESLISSFKTFGLIFLSIGILTFIILFLEHRAMFRRTLKYGGGFLKYYDWDSIIKKMTDYELLEIVNGKTHHPRKVITLAKDELKTRKTDDK